jgi:hypothetical protein
MTAKTTLCACKRPKRPDAVRCRACFLASPAEGYARRCVTPALRKAVVKRYLETDLTVEEIGQSFGLTARTVWRAVKGHANRAAQSSCRPIAA